MKKIQSNANKNNFCCCHKIVKSCKIKCAIANQFENAWSVNSYRIHLICWFSYWCKHLYGLSNQLCVCVCVWCHSMIDLNMPIIRPNCTHSNFYSFIFSLIFSFFWFSDDCTTCSHFRCVCPIFPLRPLFCCHRILLVYLTEPFELEDTKGFNHFIFR